MVKTEPKLQPETTKRMPSPPPPPSSSHSSSSSSSCKNKKKYKGVRMRSWGSWVSEIRAPNQKTRIWLGSYSTPEAAARAYDAALICLKGSSANLNFPNMTSSLYIPSAGENAIMSPKSIQRVAAAAANSVPPTDPSSSTSSSPEPEASSPSDYQDQHDDDVVSLMQSLGTYGEQVSLMESSWYNSFDGIQSPKFGADQLMFSGVSFDPPPVIDDFYEEGDIRLWSFC